MIQSSTKIFPHQTIEPMTSTKRFHAAVHVLRMPTLNPKVLVIQKCTDSGHLWANGSGLLLPRNKALLHQIDLKGLPAASADECCLWPRKPRREFIKTKQLNMLSIYLSIYLSNLILSYLYTYLSYLILSIYLSILYVY